MKFKLKSIIIYVFLSLSILSCYENKSANEEKSESQNTEKTNEEDLQSNCYGTYVNSTDDKQYIELKKDGEFFLQKDWAYTGKYEINGNSITMSTQLGFATKGQITSDEIKLGIGNYIKQ